MSKAKQTACDTLASRETLISMVETLPGALFFLDDTQTIVYANARARILTGATLEQLLGNPFWRSAPQLVSTALYQAVRKTRQGQAPTEVAYRAPVTGTWLHAQLAPTVGGVLVQFHEMNEPPRQGLVPQGERLYLDDLDGLQTRIAILTPEGIVLEINAVPLDAAQVPREEVIGKPLAEAPWWSFAPASQEQLRAAIARAGTGETVHFETQFHPRAGLFLHVEVVITPRFDTDHHVEYLVIAGIDITARKRAEDEIRVLVDAIAQWVWILRPNGSAEYCNQRMRDYIQMTVEQLQGEGWSMQFTHPDDWQRCWAMWQRAVQTGKPYEMEQRLRQGTTGAYRWFLVRAVPFKDAGGQIVKWFGTNTDIEEQKRAEQQHKTSEQHWRVLAETVPQLVWTTGPDNRLDYCNQRYCEYTQATFEQLQGHGWRQFLHPEDDHGVMAVRHETLATGEPFESECRLRHGPTGEYRWFLARGAPVRDETGQIVKWFGTNTDIEEQKRTEEALRQSQERVSVLMNSTLIGINVIEGEQIVDANETFLRMTGYAREDLRAGRMNVLALTAPEDLARTRQAYQELATQQSITYETEYVCKDGSRLPVLVCEVVLKHHPFQGISFVLDDSARKALEQRKDTFIGMASHELRNPLTALKLQTTLLHRQLAKHGLQTAVPVLSSMETQINTIIRLVEELLDVSKIQAGRLEYRQETVDLDALLHEITDTMQHTHPSHRILLSGAVQTSLLGDRDRLGQVFTNLLSNAIKYSPDAQTVELDLSTAEDAVTISIRDHGLGIPREQGEKIFERFYRVTDPRQRAISGLGMGLYIVAEIVKRHGGAITVDSDIGKGSTFTVTLPRKRDA